VHNDSSARQSPHPQHRRCDIFVAARPQPHPKLRQERHRRVLHRCRAYGARFVLDAMGSTQMPPLTGLGMLRTWRVLQRCRAYGARCVLGGVGFYKDVAPTALAAVTLELLCFRGFYGNAAPTGLNLCLAHGPYRDAAPTALGVSCTTIRARDRALTLSTGGATSL